MNKIRIFLFHWNIFEYFTIKFKLIRTTAKENSHPCCVMSSNRMTLDELIFLYNLLLENPNIFHSILHYFMGAHPIRNFKFSEYPNKELTSETEKNIRFNGAISINAEC